MNILYLHQYFRTPEEGGAIRSYYLAKALVQAGHRVDMITGYNGSRVLVKEVDGIRVHYLPVAYRNEMGPFRRILAFLGFILKAKSHTRMLADIDICYATSTPLSIGLLALHLKFRRNIPYIFEVRDLWPDAPAQMGYVRFSFMKTLLHRLERRIYTEAEQIVALSEDMARVIRMRCEHDRIEVIPNMADTSLFQPSTGIHAPFTIAYFGALGPVNGLVSLLSLAKSCQTIQLPVRFMVIGEGVQRDTLKEKARALNLTNLEFRDHCSKTELARLLKKVDAAYLSFADFPILETSSPNKYFDALAAGKLVITNTGGWIGREIEQCELGLYHNYHDIDQCQADIEQLITDRARIKRYQHNARKLAEERYSVELLTSRYVELFASPTAEHLKVLA